MVRLGILCLAVLEGASTFASSAETQHHPVDTAIEVPADFFVRLSESNGSSISSTHSTFELSASGKARSATYSAENWNAANGFKEYAVSVERVRELYAVLTKLGATKFAWKDTDSGRVGGGCISLTIRADGTDTKIPCEVSDKQSALKQEIVRAVRTTRSGSLSEH